VPSSDLTGGSGAGGNWTQVTVPITADELRITTESARLPVVLATTFTVIGGVGTAALLLAAWVTGDASGGFADLAFFLGAATLLAGIYAGVSALSLRSVRRRATTTWTIGQVCVSRGRDYTTRDWNATYTLSVYNESFSVGPSDFDGMRERSRATGDDKDRYCFDGAVQSVGGTLLRVESPRGNLILYNPDLKA
jgi:hypothetical protein